MARPLTPQTVSMVAGVAGIAVVLAVLAYMYLVMASVPDVAPPASKYALSGVASELNAPIDGGNNVFARMGGLVPQRQIDQSGSTVPAYSSEEIGKSDLTKIGK